MNRNFVRRIGKEIYDINNEPFLLKGVGIGGWLLFEGYMFRSFGKIDRPSRFKEHVLKMTNEKYYNDFFERFYDEFFCEEDIILIKKNGFNSIRIAIDYQFLYCSSDEEVELEHVQRNFERLDNIISLCKTHEVYVILDLHAAPGGQTGTNIDNSSNDEPELFMNELYQDQLCYIWKEIAQRYKDENIIAAYDLLNEPLPEWNSKYNSLLMPLYKRVIQSIRQVDENHMITLEGLHWSTDWSLFTELPDENILLQFHKYWNNPDVESLQNYLDVRDKLNVPIFMGEGGENNLQWYYSVFKLYNQLNISSNFWTYKKMETHNSVSSFNKPSKWDDFLKGTTSEQDSIKTLDELINNIKFENCVINQDVINHLLQKNNLSIPAYGFDNFGQGVSCFSTGVKNTSIRRDENVSITNIEGSVIEPSFKQYGGEEYTPDNQLVVRLYREEWINYTYRVDSDIIFSIIDVVPYSTKYSLYVNNKMVLPNTRFDVDENRELTVTVKANKQVSILGINILSY